MIIGSYFFSQTQQLLVCLHFGDICEEMHSSRRNLIYRLFHGDSTIFTDYQWHTIWTWECNNFIEYQVSIERLHMHKCKITKIHNFKANSKQKVLYQIAKLKTRFIDWVQTFQSVEKRWIKLGFIHTLQIIKHNLICSF